MPRFAPTIKNLLMNKEKLFELAKIPLNENCSAMLLKKLLEKLGDPGKFLIPCDFPGIDVCHALADLGTSINLMPLSIWKKLSLPELTPTRMTLELADRSITRPKGLAEDVFVKVGKFHFPTDFVVVDFEADPRVPLILGRSFLRTGRALIDVYGEEITLRVNDEAVTFNLDQTTRYFSTYDDMSLNRIDVIDVASEEYAQEVLGFSNNSSGGNPTTTFEPIISDSFLSFTPFEESDFILEEIEAFLKDDSISPEIDHADCDPEGDICLIEKLLNNDPFQLPSMNLKQVEVTKAKSSIEEPPELELKDLPSHLEYAYLEGIDKLPVIIAKGLKDDEKEALLKVLKSHKQSIAWKINDIKGIDPRFCTEKILMEEDYKPTVQSQRRVNLKIHEVIKKEVIKLLDAGMIYPISDSPWVSPVHCVPKKCGITVVANEDNELIPTRLVTGYFQIPIDPQDQEKTTFTCPYGTFAYRRMPFGLCNAPGTFQRCMMAIFHDMIEKTMEVFMDDFSVFGDSFDSCLSNLEKMLKRPMTHLLEKETPFVFSKYCIDAFETLKKKLTEAPILVVLDWNLPFELMCDASDFAIGAVLGQLKTKHFQSIHYASKTMTESQIHYTTTEKEMLTVVYAFEKFRPYLVLSKSIVYTDHSALKYLLSKQDSKPRLLRSKEENRRRDGWNTGNRDGNRTGKKEESKALVTVDGERIDWTTHSKDDDDYALMANNNSGSDIQVYSCSNECKESYANLKRLYDAQREELSNASVEIKAYTQGLKKVEAQLVAHQQGQLCDDEHVYVKIEDLDTPSFATKHVKTSSENVKNSSTHSQKPCKVNNKQLDHEINERACFVCGSYSHLIRDCDYHVKLAKQNELHKQNLSKGNGTREKTNKILRKQTWDNAQRINKQNQFVPLAVQTRTGTNPVNTAKASSTNKGSTARQSINRQTVQTSTALKNNTVKPMMNGVRPANVSNKKSFPSSRL
ncbi:reverse transcriptase domain-containing protein [Tanacetum coccineum]